MGPHTKACSVSFFLVAVVALYKPKVAKSHGCLRTHLDVNSQPLLPHLAWKKKASRGIMK